MADSPPDPARPLCPADAETLRRRLIAAAVEAYLAGGLAGLCAEGRWDLAVDAMRSLDLNDPADAAAVPPNPPGKPGRTP